MSRRSDADDWRVLVLPGDGVGPEVVRAAGPVMALAADALRERTGRGIRFETGLVGGAAYEATGSPLPPETLYRARAADAVLFGAVGGPDWDGLPADRRPERAILGLRKELDLYANLRPGRLWPGLADQSPLRSQALRGLDCLLVRENTGGIYYGKRRRGVAPDGQRYAIDTMEYTEAEIRRVAHVAFLAARRRNGRVTSIDKANVLDNSRLWREVVSEVASDYPDVELRHQLVDSAAMAMVARPASFDVIVTANLFGDILSDLLGGVVGSLGVLASANIGEGRRGLYEPVHGSAPDIAGRDLANPIGTILSFALLCEHSLDAVWLADAVSASVSDTLARGCRTADQVRRDNRSAAGVKVVGTREMGEQVARRLADRLASPAKALVDSYNYVAG